MILSHFYKQVTYIICTSYNYLCTDRSSTSDVDQSQHGGTPKVGSHGKYRRIGRSLFRLTGKGAEEGATPRQGVESSGLDTSTVKMDKQGGFPRDPCMGCRDAVVRTTVKEPLGKRQLIRVTSQW